MLKCALIEGSRNTFAFRECLLLPPSVNATPSELGVRDRGAMCPQSGEVLSHEAGAKTHVLHAIDDAKQNRQRSWVAHPTPDCTPGGAGAFQIENATRAFSPAGLRIWDMCTAAGVRGAGLCLKGVV